MAPMACGWLDNLPAHFARLAYAATLLIAAALGPILSASLAHANTGQSECELVGPAVTELDITSVAALQEVIPGSAEAFDLRFTQTAQLSTLNTGDVMRIAQTPLLPAGMQGPVLAIAVGDTDVTLTTKLERVVTSSLADVGATLQVIAEPYDGGLAPFCEIEGYSYDTNADLVDDSGVAAGACPPLNGADQAFRVTLADGIEINGVLTVGNVDVAGTLEVEQDQITGFSIAAQSRISFTGEISARDDFDLPAKTISTPEFLVALVQITIPGLDITFNIRLDARTFFGTAGYIRAGTRAGFSASAEALLRMTWTGLGPPAVIADTATFDIQISPPELDGDTAACVSLFGGGALTLSTDATYGGFLPIAGNEIKATALGNMTLSVVPEQDPWWSISGKPEVYVDIRPQLLLANLDGYSFTVVDPPPQLFFSSQDEFPFPTRGEARSAGDALRWSRVYQAVETQASGELVGGAEPTADGGAIVVEGRGGFGALIKVDKQGKRQWQRRLDARPSGAFYPYEVVQFADGSYGIAGTQNTNLWVARFDGNGYPMWSKEYQLNEGNWLWPSAQPQLALSDNGSALIVAGAFSTGAPVNNAPFAMKILADGSLQWANAFGQSGEDEAIAALVGTSDGGALLAGNTRFDLPLVWSVSQNAYTLRLHSNGTLFWSNVWGSSVGDFLFAAQQLQDGGFVVAGKADGTSLDKAPRGLLIRYDADTVTPPVFNRWHRTLGADLQINQTYFDELTSVTPTQGGFVVAGTSRNSAARTAWVAKLAESAFDVDMVWSLLLDGADADYVRGVWDIGDGLLLAGSSRSFGPGAPGANISPWLSRLPYEGYLHWNEVSGGVSQYSHMVETVGPTFDPLFDVFNPTESMDTTALEEPLPLNLTVTDSSQLVVFPYGYLQAELVRDPLLPVDVDADGVPDDIDNCLTLPNADQRDSNEDGFGNACDADLDNNSAVNFVDLAMMKAVFFSTDADADLTGDGAVNFSDLAVMKAGFFQSPGPSAIAP